MTACACACDLTYRQRHRRGCEFCRKPRCRHCGRDYGIRQRGLCHVCYLTPDIRHRYPKLASAGQGVCLGNIAALPLGEPTAVPPGPRKVAVLEARVLSGQSLWHPQDMQWEDNNESNLRDSQ